MKKIILVTSCYLLFMFFMAISLSLILNHFSSSGVYLFSNFEHELGSYSNLVMSKFPYFKGHEYFVSYVSAGIGFICYMLCMKLAEK
ncbi:MAG: hypothetical protein LEGION0403_FIIPPAGN_02670 [Legionella sp.]